MMLFNPDWKKSDAKADPFSLESLVAWLEKQPADGAYDFHALNGECLLCQYLAERFSDPFEGYMPLDFAVPEADWIARTKPWTFGAALQRARTAISNQRSSAAVGED